MQVAVYLKEKMETKTVITSDIIKSGLTYEQYRSLIDKLVSQNKTTGPVQSESLLEYTKLNIHRMNRLDKHTALMADVVKKVKQTPVNQIWVVISEGWCGDASQIVPVIHHLSVLSDKIDMKILLRDENPDVMDAYLTNGTRSIPKLISFDALTLDELFVWGPRPQKLQTLIAEIKAQESFDKKMLAEQIHKWYSKDRTTEIQLEVSALV